MGAEYQLFDDGGRKKSSSTTAGALYSLYAPNEKKKLKPIGEFNTSRIVVRHGKIEHWLNGEKIIEADMNSDLWKQRIGKSKFAKVAGFLKNPTGRIQVQDHGKKIWFRSIKIREFDAKS